MSDKGVWYILIASLILCGLIYCDAHFSPLRTNNEIIQSSKAIEHHGKSFTSHDYIVITNKHGYSVTSTFSNSISIGDTIAVYRSRISSAPLKLGRMSGGNYRIYEIGYLTAPSGSVWLALVAFGGLLLLIFFRFMKQKNGRRNLAYTILICSVVLVCFHLCP